MSGHKRATVRLNQQDVYRLEQLGNHVSQVEQDYQDIQVKIQQHRAEQFDQANLQTEIRQNEYHQVLNSYQNDLCRLEQATSQALFEHTLAMQDQLSRQENSLSDQAQAMIEQQAQYIHQVLQDNQQAQFTYFQAIERSIKNVQQDQDRKNELAQEAVESANALMQSFCQVYPHERYFPGAVQRIHSELELAVLNLHHGLPEAALLGAQQVSQQISGLRLGLEEITQRTAWMQSLAVEKVVEITLTLEQNAFVPAVDLEGNPLDTRVDVDYWSKGRLSSLHQRCAGFLKQLRRPASSLEYEDLERMVQFVIPQLEQALTDIISQARLKIVLSQIRFNIAQRILEALAGQGFELQQGLYLGSDERQPYQVVTRNLEGSEVQVCISSGQSTGTYDIQIDALEAAAHTEAELRQRASELLGSLQSLGIKVGQIQEIPPTQKPPFIVQSRQRMRTLAPGLNPYVH